MGRRDRREGGRARGHLRGGSGGGGRYERGERLRGQPCGVD